MIKLSEILANNMRKHRKELGYTQAMLAEKCELSLNYIQYIENRKRFPSEEVMEKIAIALNIEPYQLFLVNDTWKSHLLDKVNEAVSQAFEEV